MGKINGSNCLGDEDACMYACMHVCVYACMFRRVLPGAKISLPSNAPFSKYGRDDGTMSVYAVANASVGWWHH